MCLELDAITIFHSAQPSVQIDDISKIALFQHISDDDVFKSYRPDIVFNKAASLGAMKASRVLELVKQGNGK